MCVGIKSSSFGFIAMASFWEGKKPNVLDWRGCRIVGNDGNMKFWAF